MTSRGFKRLSQQAGCRRRGRRRGFVLIVVLLLITVTALSLGSLVRRSLQIAAHAAAAQEEFERRWQTVTLTQALLTNAEAILAMRIEEGAADGNRSRVRQSAGREGRIDAGRFRHRFVLADENARVNVNMILREAPDSLSPVLHRLLPAESRAALTILEPPRRRAGREPVRSWGQVIRPKVSGTAAARLVQNATRNLTCWGSGRINVFRASDEAIAAAGQVLLAPGVTDRLLQARSDAPADSVETLIARMDLRTEDRLRLQRLLTDRSDCLSLWLMTTDGRRDWVRFAVVSAPGSHPPAYRLFTW